MRDALRISGLGTGHLAPVHLGFHAAHIGHGHTGHRCGLELLREALQCQRTPQVGCGGVPGAALLTRNKAADQARQVALPGRVIHGHQQQARQIHIRALHQPPPVVILLVVKAGTRAVEGQTRAQNLHGLGQLFVALGDVRHVLQYRHPVNHGVGWPHVGRDVDAVEHAHIGVALRGQRLNGGQFAHFQILQRAPEIALQAAFDKADQGHLHLCQLSLRNHIALVHRLGQRGQIDQMRCQRIAAPAAGHGRDREVVGKTVVVQIAGQLGHAPFPQRWITHAHGFAGDLLQAAVRIA